MELQGVQGHPIQYRLNVFGRLIHKQPHHHTQARYAPADVLGYLKRHRASAAGIEDTTDRVCPHRQGALRIITTGNTAYFNAHKPNPIEKDRSLTESNPP
jgi:hypothetical protein